MHIRQATRDDVDALCALLPRLAAFDIPSGRDPEHLWRGDEKMLRRYLTDDDPAGVVLLAEREGAPLGVAFASLRAEMLSGAPSAHLEALAVAESAQGRGIGRALMAAVEAAVIERGATSMTLHVFAANTRARGLYERLGYDGEILRYTKTLS
jgi:ribosomal protein S18 acetylase RimI-like enzyme